MSAWAEYAVDKHSKTNPLYNTERRPLLSVSHVAHIDVALDIIRDSRIDVHLVKDKSVLNKRRIQVVWFSPNDWNDGFRYGNVQFTVDWKTLIAGKRAYWIEVMTEYKVHAPRILLTTVDRDKDVELKRYDPATDDGPWWHDQATDTHYWNGKHTLEIVVEEAVTLDKINTINFVKHHSTFCNINPSACPDKGLDAYTAGARFVAGLAGRRMETSLPKPLWDGINGFTPDYATKAVVANLGRQLKLPPEKFKGSVLAKDEAAPALARAILNAASAKDQDEQHRLTELFATDHDFYDSWRALLVPVIAQDTDDEEYDFSQESASPDE